MAKMTWNEVLAGYESENIKLSAHYDGAMVEVLVDEQRIFYGCASDAYVTFIGLSRLFGPKTVKKLLKLKDKDERLVKNDL